MNKVGTYILYFLLVVAIAIISIMFRYSAQLRAREMLSHGIEIKK